MRSVTKYDSTGEFISSYEGNDNDILAFLGGSSDFVEGTYKPIEYYFSLTEGEVIAKGDKPSQTSIWNTTTKNWENDRNNLESAVREIRNNLLTASDWTQVSDNALSVLKRTEWQNYRQALRDILTINSEALTLEEIVWPVRPTA